MHLRPYQSRAIEACRAAYLEGARRLLLVLPTGAGKTVCFSHIAAAHLAQPNRRVLILTHRQELVTQAVRTLSRVGVRAGTAYAGRITDPDAPALVGLVDTLRLAPSVLRRFAPTLTVVDEAHHGPAETWMDVLADCPTVLGVTATPSRLDGKPLGHVFDRLVVGATVAELQALGHLVPCEVLTYKGRARADAAHAIAEHAQDRRAVVVYCNTVKAAKALAAQVGGECVHGQLSEADRQAILGRYARGETRILTNCMVLTEGWDEPVTDCIVVDRGCSSAALWLQMVGRGLRPAAGKQNCLVLDTRGAVYKHGLPEEDRVYSLDGDPIKRADATCPIRQCDECGCVSPGGVQECPRCGYRWPLPVPKRAEKVRLLSPEEEARLALRREWYREEARRAAEKGWKPKAVAIRYKQRFGFWPTKEVMYGSQ